MRSAGLESPALTGSWVLLIVFLIPPPDLAAQTAPGHLQLFAVAGPGRFAEESVGYAGGGVEYVRRNGVGAGVELATAWGFSPNRPGDPGRTAQMTTVYATAQSVRADRKLRPFVRGGLGFIGNAIGDSQLAYVFGGGGHWWVREGFGLRTELLVPLGLSDSGGAVFVLGVAIK